MSCLDGFSERLQSKWARAGSYTSADDRRAAFPPHEPYPEPTRALVGAPPLRIGAEATAFHALPDGRQLFWRSVAPDGPLTGVMVFFHGYGDHSSFHLLQTAKEYVSALGVLALLVDQSGHGRSDGVQALMRSWTNTIIDTEHWCDHVVAPACTPASGPPLSVFAYGQSMGGAVLLDLAMRKPTRFDGLVLTAPMVRIADETRPHPVVESVLRHVACRIPILRDMAVVPNDGFVSDVFAVDARWRMDEHLDRNKLNYNGPTRLITGLTLIDASDGIASRMEALHTPFIVIHGEADRTTLSKLSEELFRRASAVDKTIELVEGARHGVDFGETPEVMEHAFNAAFSWVRARLATRGTAKSA